MRFTPSTRRRVARSFTALFLLMLCLAASRAAAAEVVLIEEEWELEVGDPDEESESPQVTCVMSPVPHVDGVYASFDVNHQGLPVFVSGGMQAQLWEDDMPLVWRGPTHLQLISQAGETVRWKQSLALADGRLVFRVAGESPTWQSFGGDQLAVSAPTSLTTLAGYDPSVSLANSGVGFASNRVRRLTLVRFRAVTSDGDILEQEVGQEVQQ